MRAFNEISGAVLDSSLRIHKGLGPGLLESVYLAVLARDLEQRGFFVEVGRGVAFSFEGMHFNQGLVVDLLIDHKVVVELKSVEKIAPVHFKQLLTYLRLLDLRLGLLVNFGGATLKEGFHRILNGNLGDEGV